uniref:Uncharacterized protein n=1 Tax=Anguilla anguilla TaxID=7936 RepID=A0A0E9QSM8_ANGAN
MRSHTHSLTHSLTHGRPFRDVLWDACAGGASFSRTHVQVVRHDIFKHSFIVLKRYFS